MKTTCAFTLVAAIAMSSSAAAQTDSRFHTGVLSWTPTLSLRDAGIDSNVYDEATNPKRDASAVLSPQVTGALGLTAADVQFGGSVDFVYFRRYATERAVNSRANVRMLLRGSRVRPYVSSSFLNARERVNSEIDVRARRQDHEVGTGLGIRLTPRATLDVGGSYTGSTFRQGEVFRGVELAERLNRRGLGGTARLSYEVTSLTRFLVEAATSRDRFTLSPAYDANNLRGTVGFEFQPDALLKGRATIGFHQIDPIGGLAFGYEGVSAAVELGYVLLQRTRFDVRVTRDTGYSFEAQPYYLQSMYGGEVLHTLLQRIDVFAVASWETLDYPGIPERLLTAHSVDVTRYGGGVAIRAAARVRMTIHYDHTDRKAPLLPERSYDRQRVYTTLTYGF
jgi:hypothetical protein